MLRSTTPPYASKQPPPLSGETVRQKNACRRIPSTNEKHPARGCAPRRSPERTVRRHAGRLRFVIRQLDLRVCLLCVLKREQWQPRSYGAQRSAYCVVRSAARPVTCMKRASFNDVCGAIYEPQGFNQVCPYAGDCLHNATNRLQTQVCDHMKNEHLIPVGK